MLAGQLLVHLVALLSFFIPSVFMLFCLISPHYVNGINKVMMMMMTQYLCCDDDFNFQTAVGPYIMVHCRLLPNEQLDT